MRRIRPLAAALLLAAAPGCAAWNPPEFPDVIYQCEDGRRFRAIMNPNSATIILADGRRYGLYGTLRRDYARFTDGRSVFFAADRRGARLETPETIYRDCWLADEA